jgi:hypothetical protein
MQIFLKHSMILHLLLCVKSKQDMRPYAKLDCKHTIMTQHLYSVCNDKLQRWCQLPTTECFFMTHCQVLASTASATIYTKQSSPATCNGGAWGERRYSSYSFLTSARDGGEWSASCPGCALPWGKDPRYPLYRRLGGPQSQSGLRS